jgi:uncharacterized protein with PQ loop repeat
MNSIGWLGSFFLAICAFPQAWMSWKQGHSQGISKSLLFLWGGGEILTLLYVSNRLDWPLVFNYTANIFSISIIIWFKIYPRVADFEI